MVSWAETREAAEGSAVERARELWSAEKGSFLRWLAEFVVGLEVVEVVGSEVGVEALCTRLMGAS